LTPVERTRPAVGSFPTLAERLGVADPAPATTTGPAPSVWVEGEPTSAGLAALLEAVPATRVSVIRDGVARSVSAVGASEAAVADRSSRPLRDLDDVQALLGETPGADIVLVDAERGVEAAEVGRLAAVARADSVCASVSFVAPRGAELPALGAIPPPAIDGPAWGLVYIRRDALDLALDNARALDGGTAGSVRELLSTVLSTAGLVHRRLGGAAEPAVAEPRGGRPRGSTMHVTVDLRNLAGPVTGAQVQSLALLGALARTGEVRLTALEPSRLHPSVAPLAEPLRADVAFAASVPLGAADVFHRPFQVGALHDLADCLVYGRRFVLTQQDMIGERSPEYFASRAEFEDVRRATAAALASADHVGFFSEHAALDAASERALDPSRATVVPLGVDHIRTDGPLDAPPQVSALGGRPFLLVLGTAFLHKNRLFALRVLRELVARGWEGGLLLVGRDAPGGSSVADERRFLAAHPRLAERVCVIGHVTESEKRFVYRNAAVVLFPSLYEGFGLIPFEAAAFGTPCLYAWRGPVREFLPPAGALPPDFSAATTAEEILRLVGDGTATASLVSEIRACGAELTWDRTAAGYREVYRRALEHPERPVARAVVLGAGMGRDGSPLSGTERAVIQVYRRRRGFRRVVDALVRVGALTTRGARLARARRRP
jgi:glycosyltransferase involved in cell wall biosynthesis